MTTTPNPRFDLIKAIILLVLVLVSVSLFLYGLCEHSKTAISYGALAAVVTTFLGKKWTT